MYIKPLFKPIKAALCLKALITDLLTFSTAALYFVKLYTIFFLFKPTQKVISHIGSRSQRSCINRGNQISAPAPWTAPAVMDELFFHCLTAVNNAQ